MPTKPEYSIVRRKNNYGDDCQFVLRETMTPTGLVVVEELGMVNYGDVKETMVFPDGLVEPTEDEIVRYGGVVKGEEGAVSPAQDTAKYESAVNIKQLENKIAAFVLDGIAEGRQPVIAWNDLANDNEVQAFQNAASRVNMSQRVAPLEDLADTQNIGLYL